MAKVESCTHSPTHSLTHSCTHSLTHYFLPSFPYLTFPYLSLPFLILPFLSFPFLSFPFLSIPYLSFPYLSFPYLSLPYLSLPFLSFPFLTFPCLTLRYLSCPYLSLPFRTFPYLFFPCLSLPYLSLPFLSFPYLSLPYLALPFLSLPFLTLPFLSLPYLLRLLSQSGLRTRTSPNKPKITPLKFIGLPLNTHVRAPTTSITFSCTFCPKFKYEHQPTSPTEGFEIFSKHLQRKRVDPNKSQKGHLAEIYSVFGVLSFKCTHAHVEGINAIGSPSLFYVRIVTALTKRLQDLCPFHFEAVLLHVQTSSGSMQ